MPHSLNQLVRGPLRPRWVAAALGALLLAALLPVGCQVARRAAPMRRDQSVYPPAPQPPRVIALGLLRGTAPPSETAVNVSMFLFGVEPPPPLTIATPAGLSSADQAILICDQTVNAIFLWEPNTVGVGELRLAPPPRRPFAVDALPAGGYLICDQRGAHRVDARGDVAGHYRRDERPFRAAGIIAVGNAVWVTNQTDHCIEVFNRADGNYQRTIGHHGAGPAEFALPRSMARTPDGNICVVDLLNNRVQVLAPDGTWVRDVGQPGDTPGSFGRPRDVAVGPDGAIFVTDAFSQRVHAFTPGGVPLMAFGEPGSGTGALTMPSGIAITTATPPAERTLDAEHTADYYILVGEQLDRPGVRVYAWLGGVEDANEGSIPLPSGEALTWEPDFPESVAINPHWDPNRCDTCHRVENGRMQPIPLPRTDELCLTCHDGVKAPADPHPIGRPADTELVKTPADWPTVDGTIVCVTCHDIVQHCDRNTRRPAVNFVLLRGYNPQQPLEYCTICHRPDVGGRFSPHRQRDSQGRVRDDACLFCHTQRPDVPPDGTRQFEPHLRDATSDICLNCHSPHWDLSPKGHVDRPVTPRIRQWMIVRQLSLDVDLPPEELARIAERSGIREPSRLPLGEGMVTCYTCHNPHYPELFPAGSELGALATDPADRRSMLRTNWIDLCSECHHH
jgi:streptogramin lyase